MSQYEFELEKIRLQLEYEERKEEKIMQREQKGREERMKREQIEKEERIQREKEGDLTQSYDKTPYTYRKFENQRTTNKRHQKPRLHNDCGPT